MKNLLRSKKVHMMFAAAALAVASCITIKTIEMPHEVAAGGTFTVKSTIVANSDQGDTSTNWGCFGIRVPEGWTVEMPANAYEYYAEGNLTQSLDMIPNPDYTKILNHRYKKDGYVWFGFSTGYDTKVEFDEAYMKDWVPVEWAGAERQKVTLKMNDSYYIVVNAKVTAGDVIGDYELDYVYGYEEHTFYQYMENMDHDPNKDPNLMDVATFAADPTQENQIATNGEVKPSIHTVVDDIDTSVKVTKSTGVEAISADEFAIEGGRDGLRVIANGAGAADAIVTVFDVQGRQLDCKAISNGEVTLKAVKGVNLVEVLKGNKKAVKKVFVK